MSDFFHPRAENDGSRGIGAADGWRFISIRILGEIGLPHGRVIWPPRRWHVDRARELRATFKNFAGEKRRAVLKEAAYHEARAKSGRNLYLCGVCGAWGMWGPGWESWGTMDETVANVCSATCKERYKPRRRRR